MESLYVLTSKKRYSRSPNPGRHYTFINGKLTPVVIVRQNVYSYTGSGYSTGGGYTSGPRGYDYGYGGYNYDNSYGGSGFEYGGREYDSGRYASDQNGYDYGQNGSDYPAQNEYNYEDSGYNNYDEYDNVENGSDYPGQSEYSYENNEEHNHVGYNYVQNGYDYCHAKHDDGQTENPESGRRRYVSRVGTDSPYTYALPNNGYTGTGYSSSLGAYDMSKYSRTYDYPRTYDTGSRTRDVDTPYSSSRYGLSSAGSSYGIGSPSTYDSTSNTGTSRYNTGTRSYDISSGNYDNNTRSYDFSTGTSDTSSRLGSYSSRYGHHGDVESTETKQRSIGARPPHQRYKLMDDDSYAVKSSPDVKIDELRSRRHRRGEIERDKDSEQSRITGGYELYKNRKKSENQESFELERPVFSSVEGSSDLRSHSFRSRDRHSDSRVTPQPKESEISSGSSTQREKLRNYSDNSEMLAKEKTDRGTVDQSSRRHFRKSSDDDKVKTNGVHPKQSNVSLDGKDVALTVDSSEVAMETTGLSGWRRRKLEREQRERAKSEREESEKNTHQSESVSKSEHKSSLDDDKTQTETRRRNIEKIERPKSVDADTIKNILLRSDSPLLRSRYREAVRKRDELQLSSEKSSISEIADIEKGNDQDRKIDSNLETADKSSLRKAQSDDRALYSKSQESKSEKSAKENTLKTSVGHSRGDNSDLLSRKESEHGIVKRTSRNEQKEDRHPETKRKILVSRSRVDNLRDSVKQSQVKDSQETSRRKLEVKDDARTSGLKTEKVTDVNKQTEPERALYFRRLLSSTSSKDEKVADKAISGADKSVRKSEQESDNKNAASTEKLSRRAAHARRAQHHRQEGSSLVKHMSDLLFEDPKSVRGERQIQDEAKKNELKQESCLKTDKDKHLSKESSAEKSEISYKKPQRYLQEKDSDSVKKSSNENQANERPRKLSAERVSEKLQGSVQLTQFSARKEDVKGERISSESRKLDTKLLGSHDKKVSETETKTKESKGTEKISEKPYQIYGRAKTTDISSLKKEKEDKKEDEQTESIKKALDDLSSLGTTTMTNLSENTQLSRAERIAKYKEERKRQLAYISNKFGNLGQDSEAKDIVPSLFHAAREESKENGDSLSRSRSLREESPQKYLSPVLRSKSLREDLSPKKNVDVTEGKDESVPVSTGKKTSVMSIDESGKEMPLTEKIAHTRKLFEVKSVDEEKDIDTKQIRHKSLTDTIGSEFGTSPRRKSSNEETSLDKLKNRYLFGADFSDTKERKTSENAEAKEGKSDKDEKTKIKSFDKVNVLQEVNVDKVDDAHAKRRRQLPSIPMVLGEISSVEESEFKTPESELVGKSLDSGKNLSHSQDLSSVSSFKSSVSSSPSAKSSLSSVSSVSPFSAKQFAFEEPKKEVAKSDKPSQEVKTKQEFLSPTSMKVQSEKTYSIPQDTKLKMSHEKTKSSQKTNYNEEYKSQSSSGSHVTMETNVESQKTTFDTKDILAKFKELENLQVDSADNQKPEDPSDILDSDKLDKRSEETVADLKSNKATKTLSQEITKDQGKDKTETPKASDKSVSNPKSTKIRRRSPLRSRIPLSPSRKVVDQEKEEIDKKDTKSSKDEKKGKVSEVKTTKSSIVSDSNSGPPKTADSAKTEKLKADMSREKDVFGGLKVTATSSQKEKFVSEVKEIEIRKKSKSVDVMEAPKSEKVKTSSEQGKDDLAKVISSSESKIQKSEGETVSKELKSKDDKTEEKANISKPVSHKQSLEVKSQTSEKQDNSQTKHKVETVSKGDLQSDIRAPKGEVTKPSRRLSDGTKEKITSTTSIEIKSVEKPPKEKPDLKSVEKTNASKPVSSKEIPKEDVPNSAKSKLPSTDTKSSEVINPTLIQKSELEIKKVSSESEKSQKQKAYSSDEGGKSGKVKSSRSRQLKSTSEKTSKSGGLQRSRTITEKELKSPQVLKRGTKEGSSATRSKQEIRSILSRSPDANLDDLLLQNVEYLSDIETKEPWAVKRETSSKAEEEEQVKAKRFQRKKKLQRSKSESDSGRIESKERFSDDETEEFKKGQVTTGKEEKPVLTSASATIQDKTKDRLTTDASKDNRPTSIDNSSKENVSEKSHAPPHLQESTVQPSSNAQDSQSPLTTQEKTKDSVRTSKSDNLSKERKADSDHVGEVTVVNKSSYSLSELDLKGMKEADKSIDSDSTTMSEESSGRSPRSDSEKIKRKDKSSIRKSSLNVSTDGATDVGRRGLTVDEKRKAGARSPLLSSSSSSSLTKDESTDHVTTKTPVFTPNHLNEHGVTSTNISNRHGNSISNSSEQQHAQSTPRSSNNILDSILPSKFSIPSKVSTAISKFSSDGSQEKTEAVKKDTDNKSPRRIPRRNNFSSLLQKFSGSEQSSSENEQPSSQKKFGLQRQEAYTLTSSDESERRRTPERTQSLRVKKSPSPEILKDGKGIQRSGSFKSDFMKRRYSPEPENRIPLPEEKEMATPTPELAAILNRRQKVVTDQQIEGAEKERERITSKIVEREEFRPAPAEVEEVIADSEVASVLKARRKETDSASDTDTKPVINKDHADLHNEIKTSQSDPKEIHSFKSELGIAQIPDQSRVKSTQSTPLIHNLNTEKPIDKDVQSAKFASKDSKLGMSAIDTSLEVLSAVSKDISVTDNDNEPPKQTDLELSLTKVKVDSDEDVAKFITDVQKSKIEKKEDVSSLSVSESEKKTIKSERISPDRSIRSKVSPLNEKAAPKEASSSSSGLRRTESYRSKEVEKPKGILKRTSSMKKGGVIVDAELAGILQQRRQQQGDDEEEEQEITVSAKKDIDETRRREKELHPFSSSDEEETTHMSIQERIFHMKNRLDESKSCPITPKSISGSATPKLSYKGRTGSLSSGFQQGSDENTASHVSGEQLIEKLSDLADKSQASDSVVDKRKKFQQRSRDDWRTRTQPVTLEEIHEADSLQSVLSFRREVLKKASTNVFENIQKHSKTPVIGAKSEFPQPYKGQKVRRSRSERHKTLPVTAAELSAIPEGESVAMAKLRHKSDILGKRDSKADSGILSGSSDMENYLDSTEKESHTTGDSLRSLSLEMDISEDDPATLSVSAKASMFTKLEEKTKFDKPKTSASGAKRYIDRKKRERSRTQPVTEDEVKTAAEIADGNENEAESTGDDTSTRENAVEKNDEDNKETDDDLSRRSLAEKVKLFSSLKEQEKQQQKAEPPPVIKRRNRKLASRFNTQPITIEEVEKAAQYRVSPLAMSLVKPPDPEMLKGLSVSAQREIMAQHAEVVMSQPSSRSSSRHSSTVDLTQDVKSDSGKGTPKKKEEITKDLQDVKKLLRDEQTKQSEKDKSKDTTEPKSPLKQHDVNTHEELKRIMLGKVSDKDSEIKTAPKSPETDGTTKEVRKDEDNKKTVSRGSSEDDPMGKQSELRGILKKEGSFEVKKEELSKSVPKKTESKERENGEVREKPKMEEIVATNERVRELKSERTKKEKSPSPDRTSKVSSGGRSSVIRRRGRDPEQPERYLTQPTDSTPERSPETTRKIKYGQVRHKTQPVTPEEKREAENSPEGSVSIKNRLEALQKSGEEDWKKRISKQLELETKVDVKLRDKKRNLDLPRPSSIADRLNLLENSQGGWRERVEENDAKRFTVAHKLAGQVEESPLVRKLRERTKKDSESESGSELTSPSTPTREWAKIPLPKTIISGPPVVDEPKPEAAKAAEEEKKEEKEKPPVKVTVPSMDDEHFKSFFSSRKDITEITSEKVEVTMDDINEIFIIANDILPSTRKIRPKRKYTAKSKNPLKTMMTTVEVKTEYEEIDSGVAEKELRRLHTSKIAKDAGFAQAALAGLASKENFAKVELRKTADVGSGKMLTRLDPYKDIMLLHVKGRRRTQVRLVEPCAKSINSGDCYLLVTPDKIINWVGEFSNVIEKAKAADVASFILQKRDMGCKAGSVETVEEKRQHLGAGKKFWQILGGLGTISSAGPPEEDELYENHIVETNMVYKLQNNSLTPYQEYWGLQPKYEMLKKDEVLVFDFGSELYVWQGKSVKPDQRKMGVKLSRQLWEKGYDYEACDINPISPLTTEEFGGPPSKSNERPSWALFGKVNQNMETILFREKFCDWPDTSRLIKVKSTEEIAGSRNDLSELKPYDAALMIPVNTNPVSLVLEGSHVGRGVNWSEDMEGFIREQNIVTLGVKVWHVLEYDHFEVPESSYGQFHDGDTYVVRWQYMITNKGAKDLKGTQSRRSLVGRERCAYFFWQGKSSTINEKGASALMTVELDEERGPQVRVDEGKEMPCFLNLFGGRMIIHVGKREEEATNTQGPWRCYCVRSDYENELCLLEVPKAPSQLRSHSSLLMLNVNSGLLYIWHGCKSPSHTRKLAKVAAKRLKEKCPLEVGMKEDTLILISEMDENSEKPEFWSFMGVQAKDTSHYHSLLSDPSPYNHTLRMFYMSSVSGVFEVHENLNPSRTPDLVSPFPFLQSDLYKASQPALFLVDNNTIVYLWHGWWPEGDHEIENIQTGSAKSRFGVDRKCAIDTAMQYCKLKNPENPPKAVAVHAGLEPLEFTNLFPFWDVDETARSLNLKDGKEEGEITPLEEILEKVTQTRYTYEELLEDPLPEGVDPLRLESYLDDEEFEEIIELNREEFYSLPGWKQSKIKQQVGLF